MPWEEGARHALRSPLRLGDATWFDILRTDREPYAFGNAESRDFVAAAEAVSGQELEDLFPAWLYQERRPQIPELGLTVEQQARPPVLWHARHARQV